MSATYRFVGDGPELFLDWTSAIAVAGVVRDPEAPGYVAPWDPGYQQPGELRPGQEFEGPEGLTHVRVERKEGRKWAPTVVPGSEPADAEAATVGAGDGSQES